MIKLTTYLGHTKPEHTYWYIEAVPELLELAAQRVDSVLRMRRRDHDASTFPALLQRFFTDRLCTQMEASPNTIAGYRDTFRLLLRFASGSAASRRRGCRIDDLDADLVADFLVHVETASAEQRAQPQHAAGGDPVLLPLRRDERARPPAALPADPGDAEQTLRQANRDASSTEPEMEALLAAPDRSTWVGRRDHAILLVALQTGLRASELINLRCSDIVLGTGAHIRCEGKGRKERCTPLRRDTVKLLEAWLRERRGGEISRCSRRCAATGSAGTRWSTLSAGTPARQRRRARRSRQACQPARPQAQHGDGAAAAWRRSVGDRPLARARVRRDHADLYPRRPAAEGESPARMTAPAANRAATARTTSYSPFSKRSDPAFPK